MKARVQDHYTYAVTAILALTAGNAAASGFQLQEQSTSGLGLAYSGMAVAAQDASTVFWNPAAMSSFSGSDVAFPTEYIKPSTTFSEAAPGGSTYKAFGGGGDAGVSSLVPAVYARTALAHGLAVGLAINAPFGLSTRWYTPWAGMFHAVKSKSETLNINPAISYRLNDFLSLGAGVSYQRLKATLTNAVTPLVPSAEARLDGSDWAWGWNVGALVEFGEGTRLGLTYRSATDYTIRGKLSFNNPALAPLGSGARAALQLPRTASLGLSQQWGSKVRVLADYTWTGWDSIQSLTVVATDGANAGAVVANDALNFANSWRAGLGVEYQANAAWLLRAGLAYDRSPVQDAYRTPRLPDDDRKWLAVGARFAPGSRWSLDVGYAYLWVLNGASELAPQGPVPGSLLGTYKSHITIVGAQASFHF